MTEKIIPPFEAQPDSLTPEQITAGVAQTETFLRDVAPNLGRLFGMDLTLRVAKLKEGGGMATDLKTGDVLVDPRFFFEAGYTSSDAASYGILHETAAHVRTAVTNPVFNDRVIAFAFQGKPQALFNNIFEDIAGNNLIHAVLPRMSDVAAELYGERLFSEPDYTDYPRHVQFLYKTIRQEMIPDSETTVLPEVDQALDKLRNYQGQGDLIKYSTAVAKSARQAMSPQERFAIWKNIIYPLYEELLEQDRQDPERQDQPVQGESDEGESGEGEEGQGQQGGDQQPDDEQRFGSYYEEYSQDRHPEPMSEEEEEKLRRHAKEKARQQARQHDPHAVKTQHNRQLNEKLQTETGHNLSEQRKYNAEVLKWRAAIDEMRDIFQQVINERVAQKRGLSRQTFTEGAVLDPDRLVQTVIDIRNQIEEPEAFRDYETRKGETRAVGKTDYVFVFDKSMSMREDEKFKAAAASAVIGLEGLGAMQRDVEEAEATHKIDLELDIRTAIYVFGDGAVCVKPLSTKVSPKERLDTYAAVANPKDGNTRDFLALEEIESWDAPSDRRKIMIVVSDGDSNGAPNATSRTRRAVDKLRGKGWFVYGISIGSDEAENLYKPTARRVDDPGDLPKTIQSFIEATLT